MIAPVDPVNQDSRSAHKVANTLVCGLELMDGRHQSVVARDGEEALHTVSHRNTGNGGPGAGGREGGRLIFDDESAAKRVQDAFRHASDLCQKKEPF
jgi:hypothetical protein